jgi:general secretion pathway protein K
MTTPGKYQHSKLNQGLALITALMVMSLATITAISMTAEQQIYFRRTENILLHEQAYLYLLSAEDFAKVVLQDDFRKNQTDSLKDAWAEQGAAFPVENGILTGTISDMQGKFNLNNLAVNGKPKKWDEDRLRKLLAIHNLSPDLANAIIDWLDPNDEPSFPNGAEDVDYLQGEQPHRAGNGMMGSITELLYIKGIDYEAYQAIAPSLVALPATEVAVNINTAPPEVLQMLIDPLTESEAIELYTELAKNPVADPQEIASHPLLQGKKIDLNGVSVESSYFLLQSYAEIGRAKARMDSVLHRFNAENISVVLRSQGGL